jgi:hypothetical protein
MGVIGGGVGLGLTGVCGLWLGVIRMRVMVVVWVSGF